MPWHKDNSLQDFNLLVSNLCAINSIEELPISLLWRFNARIQYPASEDKGKEVISIWTIYENNKITFFVCGDSSFEHSFTTSQ